MRVIISVGRRRAPGMRCCCRPLTTSTRTYRCGAWCCPCGSASASCTCRGPERHSAGAGCRCESLSSRVLPPRDQRSETAMVTQYNVIIDSSDATVVIFSRTRKNYWLPHTRTTGGIVALFVEHRTCNQEVVGLSLSWAHDIKTLGKFLTPVRLSPRSISSYWQLLISYTIGSVSWAKS